VTASHSHLLFHYDRAEYAYYGAIAYSLDTPTWDLFTDSHRRSSHLRRCGAVADMGLHGTTVLAGTALHAAVVHGGAKVSTWTLKRLAIGFSTITLLLWLVLLARAWRSPSAVAAFGALFILGPLPLVKLNLLFWGTHELVLLLAAVLLALIAPWITQGPPPGPRAGALRAAVFGAASAVAFGFNFSLLLPTSIAAVWLTAKEPTARRRTVAALCGAAAFALVWTVIATRPTLQDAGFTIWPGSNPRVEEVAGHWWGPLAWARALTVAPGLVPGLIAAGWLLVRPSGKPGHLDGHPFTRFLAVSLGVGFVVTAALPMAWMAGADGAQFQHRYVAPLYPISAAVLAAWCVSHGRALGGGALALLLAGGLVGQVSAYDSANLEIASRYDGARLYCHIRGEDCRDIPVERFRMGGASARFLDGMRILTRHQKLEQLEWIDRTELREVPPEATVGAWIVEGWKPGSEADREEFLHGVGYALRLLYPPSKVARLDPLWEQLGEEAEAVQHGYDLAPASLEQAPR